VTQAAISQRVRLLEELTTEKPYRMARAEPLEEILSNPQLAQATLQTIRGCMVTINEAIDLGKEYSNEESRRFLNGVLDRMSGELGRPLRQAE